MPPRDPLRELTKILAREQRVQFRLSDENDLQRLMIAVQIRQQADLFEHVGPDVLSLVEDENRLRRQAHQRIEELLKHFRHPEMAGLNDPPGVVGEQAEAVENLPEEIVN